jgi:hypothetical protein
VFQEIAVSWFLHSDAAATMRICPLASLVHAVITSAAVSALTPA